MEKRRSEWNSIEAYANDREEPYLQFAKLATVAGVIRSSHRKVNWPEDLESRIMAELAALPGLPERSGSEVSPPSGEYENSEVTVGSAGRNYPSHTLEYG